MSYCASNLNDRNLTSVYRTLILSLVMKDLGEKGSYLITIYFM